MSYTKVTSYAHLSPYARASAPQDAHVLCGSRRSGSKQPMTLLKGQMVGQQSPLAKEAWARIVMGLGWCLPLPFHPPLHQALNWDCDLDAKAAGR